MKFFPFFFVVISKGPTPEPKHAASNGEVANHGEIPLLVMLIFVGNVTKTSLQQ